jgi:hypothetical protein
MIEGTRTGVRVHIHASVVTALFTALEFLIAWIPIKIIAALYEGRSALASAVLNVL